MKQNCEQLLKADIEVKEIAQPQIKKKYLDKRCAKNNGTHV
jgi:hypothetical protein